MDRMEEIEKVAEKYFWVRFKESAEKINRYYSRHKTEVCQNFTNVICEGTIRCQQIGKRVQYVFISFLESSILTQSYDLQVAFYNEKTYLDDTPVYVYWKPLLVFSKVEEDMVFFKKKVLENVVRVRDYEMDVIRRKYLTNHYLQILLFLQLIMPSVLENNDSRNVFNDDLQVMFGRYMERPILIYQSGEVS